MIDREQIFAEAKRQGLMRAGLNFIDRNSGIYLNSAFLISCARRLAESMTLEEAIKKLIEEECLKGEHRL